MQEIWMDIKGFKNFYMISSKGRIKSVDRIISDGKGGKRKHKGRILKQRVTNCGYKLVTLHKNGKYFQKTVHRLVAEAFLKKPRNKNLVNHIDGNKKNNSVFNLSWCNASENVNHAYKNNLRISKKGEDCHTSKLTKVEVNKIRKLYETGSFYQKELAKMFGVSRPHISSIVNFKYWE